MDSTSIPDLRDVLDTSTEETEPSIKKFDSLNSMRDLFEAVDSNCHNSQNKSWTKLNKTDRLLLLNKFIEKESKEKQSNKTQLEKVIHSAFNRGMLNKQSVIEYDIVNNSIISIKCLQYDESKNNYEIKKNNNIKVQSKPKSKSNIDKILNKSKKNR